MTQQNNDADQGPTSVRYIPYQLLPKLNKKARKAGYINLSNAVLAVVADYKINLPREQPSIAIYPDLGSQAEPQGGTAGDRLLQSP
jgi:hypothetical protein